MDFIQTPRSKPKKVRSEKEVNAIMSKDTMAIAVKQHKDEIKLLKQSIHKHKLLIKQARLAYKISQS